MKARYNRISTANQNIERQLAKQHSDEVLFNDVVSGTTPFNKRKKGNELLQAISEGKFNYVAVSSIDRLGRNLYDITQTLEFFKKNDITLRVDNLGMESRVLGKPNQTFNLIVGVLANVAEMEHETLLERQREGIAIAKANNTYKGRVRGSVESDDEFISKYKEVVKFLKMGKSLRDTVSRCSVSLGTVQKVKMKMKSKTV